MYKKNVLTKTSIRHNKSYLGESIEQKVRRILNNKEPITEPGVVLTYTDRKDGVKPEMNIRTDRWELATEAMDKVNQDKLAKRMERHKPTEEKTEGEKGKEANNKEGGAQSSPQGGGQSAS